MLACPQRRSRAEWVWSTKARSAAKDTKREVAKLRAAAGICAPSGL
jgi:hypothetical protein